MKAGSEANRDQKDRRWRGRAGAAAPRVPTGANPAGSTKRSTSRHPAAGATAAPSRARRAVNLPDPSMLSRRLLSAPAVPARIRTVVASRGRDAGRNREPCRGFGRRPRVPGAAGRMAAVWAGAVGRESVTGAWRPENRRLARRHDQLGLIVQPLLRAACRLLVAGRLARGL